MAHFSLPWKKTSNLCTFVCFSGVYAIGLALHQPKQLLCCLCSKSSVLEEPRNPRMDFPLGTKAGRSVQTFPVPCKVYRDEKHKHHFDAFRVSQVLTMRNRLVHGDLKFLAMVLSVKLQNPWVLEVWKLWMWVLFMQITTVELDKIDLIAWRLFYFFL